jgi:hypothetical protein
MTFLSFFTLELRALRALTSRMGGIWIIYIKNRKVRLFINIPTSWAFRILPKSPIFRVKITFLSLFKLELRALRALTSRIGGLWMIYMKKRKGRLFSNIPTSWALTVFMKITKNNVFSVFRPTMRFSIKANLPNPAHKIQNFFLHILSPYPPQLDVRWLQKYQNKSEKCVLLQGHNERSSLRSPTPAMFLGIFFHGQHFAITCKHFPDTFVKH